MCSYATDANKLAVGGGAVMGREWQDRRNFRVVTWREVGNWW